MDKEMKNREREINASMRKYGFEKLLTINTKEKAFSLKDEEYNILSDQEFPENLRLMFQELGTSFIKLGQFLSTRPDMVGEHIASEFEKLHDDNTPITYEKVKGIIERELNANIEDFFEEFSEEYLATASISQLHAAKLISGEKVAVKVQKEGIIDTLEYDISIMKDIASQIHKYNDDFRKYNLPGMIDEFSHRIKLELDFTNKAINFKHISADFSENETAHVPSVYQDYSTSKVLTMNFIDDTSSYKAYGVDTEFDKYLPAKHAADSLMKKDDSFTETISTADTTSSDNTEEIPGKDNSNKLDNGSVHSHKKSTKDISTDDKKIGTTGIDLTITPSEDSYSVNISVDVEEFNYSDFETTAFEFSDLILNVITKREPQTVNLTSTISSLNITDFNRYNLKLTGLDFSLLPAEDFSSLDFSILMSELNYAEFDTGCFDFSDLNLLIRPSLDSSGLYISVTLSGLRIINYGIYELNLSDLDLKINIPDITSNDFEVSIGMSSLYYTDYKDKYLNLNDVDVKLSPMMEASEFKSSALISDILYYGSESDEFNVPFFNISGIDFKNFKVSGLDFYGINLPDLTYILELSFINLSGFIDILSLGLNGRSYRISLDSTVSYLVDRNLFDLNLSDFNFLNINKSDMDFESLNNSTFNLTGFNFSDSDLSNLNLTGIDLSNIELSTLMKNLNISNLNSALMNSTGMDLTNLDLSNLTLSNLIIELDLESLNFSKLVKNFILSSFGLTKLLQYFNLTDLLSILLHD